ncbi:MAG TPA: AMP-binding protein [Thermoanaerobaculia bacterium]|nr:AMP-binding protein [Thermoanaerobaculia bacterium]
MDAAVDPSATLLETLARRGRETPAQPAFTWRGRTVSWGELDERIAATTATLRHRGVSAGDRVLVAPAAGDDFLACFWGALRAGAVAVPLPPRSGGARLLDVAAWLGAAGVIVDRQPAPRWDALATGCDTAGRWLLDAAEATAPGPGGALPPLPAADDLAFLQLTSGSTGAPKAVRIRHRDLAANVAQMTEGLAIDAGDVFLSWLPLHHDMGLILMSVVPLVLGAELHLLPPGMAAIRGWMVEAARRRATFTAAPDFAYRLCLRLAREHTSGDQARGQGGLDLTALRVALDAAEPVRASTVHAFERAFALPSVVTPAYGLAEATVGVSAGTPGAPLTVDERGFVAVGTGFPGVRLAIGSADAPLPAGEVGEILVASPALADGYWGEPPPRPGRWLATGDLGYLDAAGRLYVVGRAKEVILHGGTTLAPREIEETVDRLPFVRRSAALGIDRQRLEGEQAYIFAEVGRGSRGDLPAQAAAVVQAFQERLGFRPGRVYLVAPGTLPMTANGKLQYAELRRRYLAGELARDGALLFPDR